MKVTVELVFAVITLIVVILGIDAYLSVQRESAFLQTELQKKAYRIGNALKELVADAWRRQGPDYVFSMIQTANERDRLILIRWVWLDAQSGDKFSPQLPPTKLEKLTPGETTTYHYRRSDGKSLLL